MFFIHTRHQRELRLVLKWVGSHAAIDLSVLLVSFLSPAPLHKMPVVLVQFRC